MYYLCFCLMLLSDSAPLDRVLDDFHKAASEADRARYFAHLSENAVFHGTDGDERWTKTEFEAKYGPYMDSGKGWTFKPTKRNWAFSEDGSVAWFDEKLASEHYGDTRGTGVLIKVNGVWKIAQYHLTIPIPNDLAKPFVEQIRRYQSK